MTAETSFGFRLLAPVRALVKRWGTTGMKARVWETEYRAGQWIPETELDRPVVCDWVEKYSNEGHVLDLGCGDGIVGRTLDESRYARYTGVDISEIAVQEAAARSAAVGRAEKNRFVADDIRSYDPGEKCKVILFRASLYYFSRPVVPDVLAHHRGSLTDDGVIMVVMDDVQRHQWIVDIIKSGYDVIEEEFFGDLSGDNTILIVFR